MGAVSGFDLTTPTIAQRAAQYLRWLIFSGELGAGDRVPVDEIAARLGVSRVPVREATILLAREGWLSLRPRRGVFVNDFDRDAVADHYRLLSMVLGLAVELAAERANDSRRSEFAALRPRLVAVTGPQDALAFTQEFLQLLMETIASPRIASVHEAMAHMVPGNYFEVVDGSVDHLVQTMPAVLRAVVRGDGDRASKAMRALTVAEGALVVALLDAREQPSRQNSSTKRSGSRRERTKTMPR